MSRETQAPKALRALREILALKASVALRALKVSRVKRGSKALRVLVVQPGLCSLPLFQARALLAGLTMVGWIILPL